MAFLNIKYKLLRFLASFYFMEIFTKCITKCSVSKFKDKHHTNYTMSNECFMVEYAN